MYLFYFFFLNLFLFFFLTKLISQYLFGSAATLEGVVLFPAPPPGFLHSYGKRLLWIPGYCLGDGLSTGAFKEGNCLCVCRCDLCPFCARACFQMVGWPSDDSFSPSLTLWAIFFLPHAVQAWGCKPSSRRPGDSAGHCEEILILSAFVPLPPTLEGAFWAVSSDWAEMVNFNLQSAFQTRDSQALLCRPIMKS